MSHAKVTVEIEVPVRSEWGNDCTLAQVYKQAREEAVNKIDRELRTVGFRVNANSVRVTAIVVPNEKETR